MIDTDPIARVEAYIADWHAGWLKAKASFSTGRPTGRTDFETWRAIVSETDARHFARGKSSDGAGSFSGTHPDHAPGSERVTGTQVAADDRVWVETESKPGVIATYYVYALVREDGEWRIAALTTYLSAPGEPLVPEANRAAILAGARRDAPLSPLPPNVALNVELLFTPGRTVRVGDVRVGDEETVTSVQRAGVLACTSGVLGVRDLAYGGRGFAPLARSIEPGEYPVDVACAFGRNAAARVTIDAGAAIATWHPAEVAGGGHVIGVDAGNLAVFDAASYLALEARTKERLVLELAEAARPRAIPLPLGASASNCIFMDSGFGDGAYPCYWGADASGRPVALLVDFLVLAEFPKTTLRVPWSDADEGRACVELAERGVHLRVEREPGTVTFTVEGPGFDHLRVLDRDERELVHSHRLPTRVQGAVRSLAWKHDAEGAAAIELTLGTGYRHI